MNKQHQRMLDGARIYAEFDKSDPFAYSRAVSHLNSGIAGIRPALYSNDPNAGSDAFYKADRHMDVTGNVYFTNVQRP